MGTAIFCHINLANEMGLYLLFFPVLRYRKDTGETPVSEERGWGYKDSSSSVHRYIIVADGWGSFRYMELSAIDFTDKAGATISIG